MTINYSSEKIESKRLKEFREKLKSNPAESPNLFRANISEMKTKKPEKNPTKWGDWQNNGRVSDF